MESRPAPHVLRIVKKGAEPGSLARDYLAAYVNSDEDHNAGILKKWLEKIKKNKKLGKGSYIGVAWPSDVDCPLYREFLTPNDKARIRERAKAIEKRRKPATVLASRLPEREKEMLNDASAGMRLQGYASEHEVDEAFSEIHQEYPWLSRATEILWKQARLGASRGLPFRVGPVILLGPPGVGKSSLAREIGKHFRVPTIEVDAGTTGGVFDLQGSDQRWGNSAPGRIMSSFLQHRIGNPLVVVDEIDAGSSAANSTKGSLPGLFKVLMSMLERGTAERWVCPYFQVPVDLRGLSWILTANSVAGVEQALLDRCQVIELERLTISQLTAYARGECLSRMDDHLIADVICKEIELRSRRGEALSLRHVARMIDRAEAVLMEPIRH